MTTFCLHYSQISARNKNIKETKLHLYTYTALSNWTVEMDDFEALLSQEIARNPNWFDSSLALIYFILYFTPFNTLMYEILYGAPGAYLISFFKAKLGVRNRAKLASCFNVTTRDPFHVLQLEN